jgi:hypothetical protein
VADLVSQIGRVQIFNMKDTSFFHIFSFLGLQLRILDYAIDTNLHKSQKRPTPSSIFSNSNKITRKTNWTNTLEKLHFNPSLSVFTRFFYCSVSNCRFDLDVGNPVVFLLQHSFYFFLSIIEIKFIAIHATFWLRFLDWNYRIVWHFKDFLISCRRMRFIWIFWDRCWTSPFWLYCLDLHNLLAHYFSEMCNSTFWITHFIARNRKGFPGKSKTGKHRRQTHQFKNSLLEY